MARKKQFFSKLQWFAFQFHSPQPRPAFYVFFCILIDSLNIVPLFVLDRGVSLSAIKMSSLIFRGVLPEKLDRGVRPAYQNTYPIYDQNLRFSLPYLWPDEKFDSLFKT